MKKLKLDIVLIMRYAACRMSRVENVIGSMGLTRDDSQTIKGMAILAMLIHHFFGAYWIPVKLENFDRSFLGLDASWYICCIYMFAFVSGYGLCSKAVRQAAGAETPFDSLISFYRIYIFCWVLLSAVAFIAPVEPIFEFHASAVSWLMLCPLFLDWWYAVAFLVFAGIFYPIMYWVRQRGGDKAMHIACFALCLIAYMTLFCRMQLYEYLPLTLSYYLFECHMFSGLPRALMYTPVFAVGVYFCSFVNASSCKDKVFALAWLVAAVALFVFAEGIAAEVLRKGLMLTGLLGTVLFSLLIRKVKVLRGALVTLGAYSVWMWLTHRLIFGYWFAEYFYTMNSMLAICLIVVLNVAMAWGLQFVFRKLCAFFSLAFKGGKG